MYVKLSSIRKLRHIFIKVPRATETVSYLLNDVAARRFIVLYNTLDASNIFLLLRALYFWNFLEQSFNIHQNALKNTIF